MRGPDLRPVTPHVSPVHLWGAELRHWRLMRKLSVAKVGAAVTYSRTFISMLELGERKPTLDLARRLDVLLNTGGTLERLMPPSSFKLASLRPAGNGDTAAPPWAAEGAMSGPLTTLELLDSLHSLWEADQSAAPLTRLAGRPHLDCPSRMANRGGPAMTAANNGRRRVGRADLVALADVGTFFTDLDHRLGGGHARTALLSYIDSAVSPLLRGNYRDAVGQELFAAAARLLNLVGFMSFDSGYHALAGCYFARSLSLARVSDNEALAAHILTDMAMQACHLGQSSLAVELAEAATGYAHRSGARRSSARSHAVLGRCRALAGDASGADRAMSAADRALERSGDGPSYVQFFDYRQLTTEAMYAAGHLSRWRTVRATADITTAKHEVMQRRHVLATATLATTFTVPGTATLDIPRACRLLAAVVPLLPSLASARSLNAINEVRRALARYDHLQEVQELEHQLIEAYAGSA